jgi:biotin carboxyl carrier protein
VAEYLVTAEGQEHLVEVVRSGAAPHAYLVTLDGRTCLVDAVRVEDGVSSFIMDGACFEVHASREGDRDVLLINGEHHEVEARNRRALSAGSRGAGVAPGRQVVRAPMPGRVVRVMVREGEAVEEGSPLLILEAMKMENQLRSPKAGTVVEIPAAEDQVVATGQKLVVVE